jgi:hypothetical protein
MRRIGAGVEIMYGGGDTLGVGTSEIINEERNQGKRDRVERFEPVQGIECRRNLRGGEEGGKTYS